MRKLPLFVIAVLAATGAFWLTMLTTPPTTVASVPSSGGMNVYDMMNGATLPDAELASTH